ncbi:MAG: helix-turn-helix transcriptional regulator [Bacteroidales bacterium]|nr:helix-turn-helix transcriptional regulator [Bacteroidales bacterium]
MAKTNNILSFDIVSPEGKAKALAQRAKTRRLEMNLTQEGLSMRSGLPLATYRRFERTGKISLDGLLHVAYALDALNDFDQVFATHKYATLDEAINASQNNRKRGKRNE